MQSSIHFWFQCLFEGGYDVLCFYLCGEVWFEIVSVCVCVGEESTDAGFLH
jgi:hypothetical protein